MDDTKANAMAQKVGTEMLLIGMRGNLAQAVIRAAMAADRAVTTYELAALCIKRTKTFRG